MSIFPALLSCLCVPFASEYQELHDGAATVKSVTSVVEQFAFHDSKLANQTMHGPCNTPSSLLFLVDRRFCAVVLHVDVDDDDWLLIGLLCDQVPG